MLNVLSLNFKKKALLPRHIDVILAEVYVLH